METDRESRPGVDGSEIVYIGRQEGFVAAGACHISFLPPGRRRVFFFAAVGKDERAVLCDARSGAGPASRSQLDI